MGAHDGTTTQLNNALTASLLSKILGRNSRKYAQVQMSNRRTFIKDEKSKIADILCPGNVKNNELVVEAVEQVLSILRSSTHSSVRVLGLDSPDKVSFL